MLIVCPNCATSYMIEPAALGPAGRTVRCARCKATWFAGAPKAAPDVAAFVDSVIAEAQAMPTATAPAAPAAPPAAPDNVRAAADDFGAEEAETLADTVAPPVMPVRRDEDHSPIAAEFEEPVVIDDGPSLVPPIEQVPAADEPNADLDSDDIETFAARRQRLQARRKEKRRSSRWTAIILLLLAFNVALVGARSEVVRYLPQTASLFAAIGLPVNLRHLKFEDVKISKEMQDGVNMLIVQGWIVSTAGKPAEVPRLRFAARNATGQELYVWTALASRSILDPGDRLEFTSQMASPPADAIDVMVRFFNAQDAMAGIK